MTAPLRVLVVDDSVVVRRLLSDVLAREPDLTVVGTAANGQLALAKIEELAPDVVTLDVEMPELDGVGALREIRRRWPRLPVIMFSTLTARGASATLDALAAGANDYLTKPVADAGLRGAADQVLAELPPRIRALCGRRTAPPAARPRAAAPQPGLAPPSGPPALVEIVAIATSTGGPTALMELFRQLPAALPVPIVVVQHMPPIFTRLLAERLTATGPIPVREGEARGVVAPGMAWLAPGDHHMEVIREPDAERIRLHQGPAEHSCRPAADVLFRSVAQVYKKGVLGVVLTGMGSDAVQGARRIRAAGGAVIAQDQATSVVWGMPGLVTEAGLANEVLPLDRIAQAIITRVSAGRVPAVSLAGR